MTMQRVNRTCTVCGKPIEKPEAGVDYCSSECFEKEAEGR